MTTSRYDRKNNLGWESGDPLPDDIPEFELTPKEEAKLDEITKGMTPFGVDIPGDAPVDDSDWPELDDEADVIAQPLAAKPKKGAGKGKRG